MLFEIVIRPCLEFAQCMRSEKLRPGFFVSHFPGACLRAIFAKFKRMRFGRLRPSATHARKAISFILVDQIRGNGGWRAFT